MRLSTVSRKDWIETVSVTVRWELCSSNSAFIFYHAGRVLTYGIYLWLLCRANIFGLSAWILTKPTLQRFTYISGDRKCSQTPGAYTYDIGNGGKTILCEKEQNEEHRKMVADQTIGYNEFNTLIRKSKSKETGRNCQEKAW